MKKVVVIIVALLLLFGGGFLLLRSRLGGETGKGVLKITSNPQTTIFLDNNQLGKTPYEEKQAPGDYTLKLIPESTTGNLVSWEGKITIRSGLLTFVNRELGSSDVTTAGEILSLEKISSSKSELAILSTPDGATVTISGEEKGTTPLVLKDFETGNFDLTVSSIGFKPRTVKIKTTAGFKLTADFQLAATTEVTVSPSPSPETVASPKSSPKTSPKASSSPKAKASPPAKPYVEILDTPTGYLNVRKEPSTAADILAKVNPGEFFSLLDEQEASGSASWYKIEYQTNKEGWISGQYAKKYE